MIRRVHAAREEIEHSVVDGEAAKIERIFGRAEVALADIEKRFGRLAISDSGDIEKIPENVAEAQRIVADMQGELDKWIKAPGKEWVNDAVPAFHRAGRDLARANLDVDFLSPELVQAAFQDISTAERAVLRVGYEDGYQIMNTVGDDVAEWFRREMLDAVIDGIPVQGPGDTLANRLIKSGRLRPIRIKTKTGRWYHISLKARGQTIARVESARIINRTHETLAADVLGGEAVYQNTNPMDSRTTDICARASRQEPMTLREWENSPYGRPPRLNPFHMCRSVLIGGKKEWF